MKPLTLGITLVAAVAVLLAATASAVPSFTAAESTPGRTSGRAIVVERSGFSNLVRGKFHFGSYGMVLRNTSRQPARGVEVTVRGFDKAGHVVAYDDFELFLIPARTRYYLGGDWTALKASDSELTRLKIRVGDDNLTSTTWKHARVSNVRWIRGYSLFSPFDMRVQATVSNPYPDHPLAADSLVSAVVFDKSGAIIGGGHTLLTPGVNALSSRRITLDIYGVPARKAASVRISVETQLL